MSFDYLKIHKDELLQNMKDIGYSEQYRCLFENVSQLILNNADEYGWESYFDVYEYYLSKKLSTYRTKVYACVIGSIFKFENEHSFPIPGQRVSIAKLSKYNFLSDEFKELINHFEMTHKAIGNKYNTIHGVHKSGVAFFFNMQERGKYSLSSITEADVISHFHAEDGSLRCGYGTAALLKRLLRCGLDWKYDKCKKLLTYLPIFPKTRKTIPYLKDDEVKELRIFIDAPNSVSLRDKAICLTLLFTGLRRGDVANLKQNDIDWEHDIICITQEKTGLPVSIPLIPALGNALYDYIFLERPENKDPHVFLSCAYSHMSTPITGAAINSMLKRVFESAGLRQNIEDRVYPHLFRHHMAIKMLGSNIPQPVISKTMGHASPSSIEKYLSSDFIHLKECSLSIDAYPVAKEVFTR